MAKYKKLAGKHVLVIGGSKGIGRGVVEASIESGARVTLVGSSQGSADAALAEIRKEYPDAAVTGVGCDLSRETVEDDLEALFRGAGAVDHVVYTAADALAVLPLAALTPARIHAAAHMRLVVPTLVGKVAGRHLPATRAASLTLTTGGIADKPAPGWSVVAFLGAGLTGLARNLALDLRPVRVNAVEPGIVDTGLWDATMTAEQRGALMQSYGGRLPVGCAGQVEDVAEAYLYAMKDGFCTGEIIKTRGGDQLV
jgi:NAD(P)-dependent dehydrogenase (short-subunit alcohol dehydrogenase family)